MRFFVPMSNDPVHARELYDQIRRRVCSTVGDVDPVHIFRIRFNNDGHPVSLAVGDSYHGLDGDPVLAIFKAADSSYVVCTRRHGAVNGEPIRVEQTVVTTVEEFDS